MKDCDKFMIIYDLISLANSLREAHLKANLFFTCL